MAKFNTIRNNFLFGEVSPQVYGRLDVENYVRAARELRNVICYPQGGVGNRPGSVFVDNSLSSSTAIRLIPYVLSTTQSYQIAISENSSTVKIYDVSNPTVSISVNTYGMPTYSASQLAEIQFAQYGTIMFLVHAEKWPVVVQAASSTSFEITGIHAIGGSASDTTIFPRGNSARFLITSKAFSERYAYQIANPDSDHYLSPSGVSGSITLSSTDGGGAPLPFFNPNMVGGSGTAPTVFKIQGGTCWVSGYISSTSVTAEVLTVLGAAASTNTWTESAWSTHRGWPRTVSFFEDRALFGANATFPFNLWGSQIGDVFEWDDSLGSGNSYAFSAALRSERLDSIQWLSPQNVLNLGTASREYIISGLSDSQTIGQSNTRSRPQTQHGSGYVQAIRADNAPVFVTRTNRRLREFVFNFDEDSYRSQDIMQFAEHIINRSRDAHSTNVRPKIINLQYAEGEFPIIWMIDSNGGLVSMTRDRQLNIAAFSYHVLGGSLSGEIPKVESISAVPSPTGTNDELWMVVVRTVNGSTVRYIERLLNVFRGNSLLNTSTSIYDKPVIVDSANFTRVSTPALVFGGYGHLVGQTLSVVADGVYVGTKVVDSSGNITLDASASEVIAGLAYRSLAQPLSIEAGSQLSNSLGTVRRIDRLVFKFTDTVGVKFGRNTSSLDQIEFRDPLLPLNQPIPLFTGDKEVLYDDGYELSSSPIVIQDLPYPFYLNAVVYEGVTYD